MIRVVVSDIFGLTPALEDFASVVGAEVILDPYNGKCMDFDDEQQAYAYFVAHSGIAQYCADIKAALACQHQDMMLIGFSAGASALWEYIGTVNNPRVQGALLFYGGQIRSRPQLQPHCPTSLVFASHERHFDVAALITPLAGKQGVVIHKSQGLHGFMNALSDNYNASLYSHYVQVLAALPKSGCVASCVFSD